MVAVTVLTALSVAGAAGMVAVMGVAMTGVETAGATAAGAATAGVVGMGAATTGGVMMGAATTGVVATGAARGGAAGGLLGRYCLVLAEYWKTMM